MMCPGISRWLIKDIIFLCMITQSMVFLKVVRVFTGKRKESAVHWGGVDPDLITLSDMLCENGHSNMQGLLLKMDVEGYEWEVLENIDPIVLEQFDQILIELHDLLDMDNSKRIINCLKKLTDNHVVVHIHANNNGRCHYCKDLITPNYLEATLLKRSLFKFCDNDVTLPIGLDAPCTLRFPEIESGRWNVK